MLWCGWAMDPVDSNERLRPQIFADSPSEKRTLPRLMNPITTPLSTPKPIAR
jgi:hypothetical protein